MRIGIATLGGDGRRSGIGRYIARLLVGLAACAAPDDRFEVLGLADEADAYFVDDARFRWTILPAAHGNPWVSQAWHLAGLPTWCRRRRCDVVLLAAANRRVAGWAPCPLVGTVHDLADLHVPGKYGRIRSAYARRFVPWLLRRLDRVITVSTASRDDIVHHAGVPGDRIDVIPHGADTARFAGRDRPVAARQVAERYGVRAPYVLYVARVEHPGKNHVGLIHAFEKLADLPHHLVLAGSDWNGAEAVHATARSSPAAKRIHVLGFVADADLPDLYVASDLLAHASLFEGFGLPLLEAMASGVPVVASRTSSLPEVGGDAVTYFDPRDADDMAARMRDALTDPALRERCVRRGLERARSFDWTRTARRTLDVLRKAAGR